MCHRLAHIKEPTAAETCHTSKIEGSMLSFKSHLLWLQPHKLSLWPPCCTMLTCGMHNNLRLIPALRWMLFAPFDCSWYLIFSEHVPLLILKVLFETHQSVVWFLCLSLWAKHDSHSSGYTRQTLLFMTFWLAGGDQQSGTLYSVEILLTVGNKCMLRAESEWCDCGTWLPQEKLLHGTFSWEKKKTIQDNNSIIVKGMLLM